MSQVNTVVIVSDSQKLVNQITQKLVLLRNLDKIKSCSISEAQNVLDGYSPDVMVLHCDNNDSNALNLVKFVKKQEMYKNLPILLITENCTRETVIDAFDSGISDILFMPIIDYELLIRVIWCLQKNEANLKNEARINFMTNLGIIQADTELYDKKYCDDFLKIEIAQTRKYSQHACILYICPDKKFPEFNDRRDFIRIVRQSVRANDSIIANDDDKYYIYLQKTKLNGAYSVFERINANLGIDAGINAGVVEIQQQQFEEIKEALESALSKANENTNSLIVASDFYSKEEKPDLDIEAPKTPVREQTQPVNIEDEYNVPQETASKYDKTSIKLFHQAYKRKLKAVIEPAFKRYEDIFKSKKQDFAVNSYTGAKSLFSVSSGVVSAIFDLEYDGIEHSVIRLVIIDNDKKLLYESETVDFTILDYRKVSLMLSELIDKFILILKNKN